MSNTYIFNVINDRDHMYLITFSFPHTPGIMTCLMSLIFWYCSSFTTRLKSTTGNLVSHSPAVSFLYLLLTLNFKDCPSHPFDPLFRHEVPQHHWRRLVVWLCGGSRAPAAGVSRQPVSVLRSKVRLCVSRARCNFFIYFLLASCHLLQSKIR